MATPAEAGGELSYGDIAGFYYPLALTSLIGLTVHPMLTFFMGRAALPIASLAVFPVVNALGFIFRSVGVSYQEVVIALIGKRHEHASELASFGTVLALGTSAVLSLVVFTPLAHVWFGTISGLTPDLIEAALFPARVMAPLPALGVVLSSQRGILVQERRTRPITIEVVGIAGIFVWLGFGLDWVGVNAAFTAFLGGRLAGNLYLLRSTLEVLRSKKEVMEGEPSPAEPEHE